MIIRTMDVEDLSPQTKGVLKKLTLFQGPESRMYNVITKDWDERHTQKVSIAYVDRKIVGWASDESGKGYYNHIICCFVRPEYRRQGIGTELVCGLIKKKKHAYVISYGLISNAFWHYIQRNKKPHLNIMYR
jgi:predicted GNAT family acetyltransferase